MLVNKPEVNLRRCLKKFSQYVGEVKKEDVKKEDGATEDAGDKKEADRYILILILF